MIEDWSKKSRGRARRLRMRYMGQGGRCHYCRRPMLFPERPQAAGEERPLNWPTWDHVVPRSQGGDDAPANLIVCCWDCNRAKGSTPEAEFRRADLYLLALEEAGPLPGPSLDELAALRPTYAGQVSVTFADEPQPPQGDRTTTGAAA